MMPEKGQRIVRDLYVFIALVVGCALFVIGGSLAGFISLAILLLR
jgi:hypothetical protein